MIPYHLAKQLKDAGFPQNVYSENYTNLTEGCLLTEDSDYIPTLSELIEACGDGFDSLLRIYSIDTWVWSCNCDDMGHDGLEGSTPEEAVAMLYLSLHER